MEKTTAERYIFSMTEKEFMRSLSNSEQDIVQELLRILEGNGVDYCIIGGLAVNAFVEPVVSLDLDIVIAADQIERVKAVAGEVFTIEEFPYSLNLYCKGSDLRIQVQKDRRYQDFISRAVKKSVLGYPLKVASLPDVLQGKIWAYSDLSRRRSKRQKDLADISRIVESYPELEKMLPDEIKSTLED